jgi:hypothetical protein
MRHLIFGFALLGMLSSAQATPVCYALHPVLKDASSGWQSIRGDEVEKTDDDVPNLIHKWEAPPVGAFSPCFVEEYPKAFWYSCYVTALTDRDPWALTRDVARKLIGICLEEDEWTLKEETRTDPSGTVYNYLFGSEKEAIHFAYAYFELADKSPGAIGFDMVFARDKAPGNPEEPAGMGLRPPARHAP